MAYHGEALRDLAYISDSLSGLLIMYPGMDFVLDN